MRALKTILIILFSLIGLWLVLSLFGPKEVRVERSTVINAKPGTVYAYLSHLKNQDEWGVWRRMDKDARFEFTGVDGTVGARTSWNGDTLMQGSQTITALEPDKSVKSELAFGDLMVCQVSLDLAPVERGTGVTWSLHGAIPFQYRAMMLFMGADESLAKDFETGLSNLKTICESLQVEPVREQPVPAPSITGVERPVMLYFGDRKVVKWSEMEAFMGDTYAKVYELLSKAGIEPAGPATSIYLHWDEAGQQADMMAAVPVPASAKQLLKGMSFLETPASKALLHVHPGDPSGTQSVHASMDGKIKADGLKLNTYVLEEYISGPAQDPDTAKWVTNVVYLIK